MRLNLEVLSSRASWGVWLIVCLVPITVACQESGLHRTSFQTWKVQDLPLLGAKVEVPEDYFYSGGDSSKWVSYLMHPVYPPLGVIDEPSCALDVRIFRWSTEELERRRAAVTKKDIGEEEREFWRWIYAEHHDVETMETTGQVVFRKDVECPDESWLVIHAVLMKTGGEEAEQWRSKDDAAIRRILDSVVCTEQS